MAAEVLGRRVDDDVRADFKQRLRGRRRERRVDGDGAGRVLRVGGDVREGAVRVLGGFEPDEVAGGERFPARVRRRQRHDVDVGAERREALQGGVRAVVAAVDGDARAAGAPARDGRDGRVRRRQTRREEHGGAAFEGAEHGLALLARRRRVAAVDVVALLEGRRHAQRRRDVAFVGAQGHVPGVAVDGDRRRVPAGVEVRPLREAARWFVEVRLLREAARWLQPQEASR